MRISRRALRFTIFFLPILFVGLAAYVAVRQYLREAKEDLAPILAAELTKALGHEVRVSSVDLFSSGAIVNGVRVAQGKTFQSGLGEMATARKVALDFDLRRILLNADPQLPLVANVDADTVWARISRDRRGVWNFQDLFKQPRAPQKRQTVGTVTITNGTLEYSDYSAPHHDKRPASPIAARFVGVDGKMQFNGDQTVTWTAKGRESAGQVRTVTVRGSYEPGPQRLSINLDADALSVPFLNRFAPPEVDGLRGRVSGHLNLLQTRQTGKAAENMYLADVRFDGVDLQTTRANETASGVSGNATITPNSLTAGLDGQFAGGRLHAQGSILDFAHPYLSGSANGTGIQLKRLISALQIPNRYAALRDIDAFGTARAEFHGKPDALYVVADGSGTVSGRPTKEIAIASPAPIRIAVSGPLSRPDITASGTAPIISYRDQTARQVAFSIAMANGKGSADFSGQVGGGTASGRANFTANGQKSTYAANLALRNMSLAAFKEARNRKAGGIVDADLTLSGRVDQKYPTGEGLIRASSVRYDRWRAAKADARVRLVGDRLVVSPAIFSDPAGKVIASGSLYLKAKQIDITAEADGIDLARLPIAKSDEGKPTMDGRVYLRDARITGPYDKPRFSAVVRGYDVAAGSRLSLDFVSVRVSGDRNQLNVAEGGQAWRFPAFVTVSGNIEKPFSDDPGLNLAGDFQRVDLQDIATLAGSELDASGTAGGRWTAHGTGKRPVVVATNVEVRRPSIGRYAFDRITGSVEYNALSGAGDVIVPQFTAEYGRPALNAPPEMIITGRARLGSDKQFSMHAETKGVKLALLGPSVSEYAIPGGLTDVSGDVAGRLVEGKATNLTGSVVATTSGLTINESRFGDLIGRFHLKGDQVTGDVRPLSAVGATRPNGIYVDQFAYNLEKETLDVRGSVDNIEIETLRAVLSRSPFVAKDPDGVIAATLKPLKPIVGAVRTGVHITGKLESPVTEVDWANVSPLNVEGQDIQTLTGRATFQGNDIKLSDATMVADNSTTTAAGTYVPGERLEGYIDANEVPLNILRKWFPDQADLAGLTGLADHLRIDSHGRPDSPSVLATLSLKDVKWTDPDLKRHLFGGRTLEIARLRTSTVTIDKGKLTIDDLGLKVMEPLRTSEATPPPAPPAKGKTKPTPAAQPVAQTAAPLDRPSYEMHASGSVDWSWQAPHIPEDARTTLNINIKDQGLALLTAFVADSGLTLDGRIQEASLTFEGALNKLLHPRQAVAGTGADQPTLHGVLNVTAKRIASATTSTEIRDLDAKLRFDRAQNRLFVDNFTASTAIVNPRYISRKSDPLTITGELPIHEEPNAPKLTLTAKKLVYAEVPLPGFKSGAAVGELSTDNLQTPATESLTVGGTVFDPSLSGTLYVRNTYVKLPDNVESTPATPPLILPFSTLNVKVAVEKGVSVATSQLNATVRSSETEPILISGPGSDPKLTGTLVVDKGTLQFPTAFFTVQKGGEIALKYPYSPSGVPDEKALGVIVNITATTRISATSMTGTRKRYTITVEARGPISSGAPLAITDPGDLTTNPFANRGLRLTFRADPPDLASSSAALRQRVTEALGGQTAIEGLFGGGLNVGGVVGDIFSQSILPGIFERSGLARSLGLEEFEVEYSQLDAFSLRLTRQLIGPLQIGYWRRLSSASRLGGVDRAAWELKLSYRLRSNLQFSWTFDEQKTNAYLVEGVFKF